MAKVTKVASLRIDRAGDMSKKGRQEIAKWLRRQAAHLLKHGDNYSKRFTAGFHITK